MKKAAVLLLGAACLAALYHSARAEEPRYDRRWFYAAFNLQVDKSADDVVALLERAGKDGYNGMVLADYKLSVLDRVTPNYFKNVARVRRVAQAAGIEIIPAIFPIGYSNGLLAHDPNLAEGLPVTDAPFLVKGKEALLVPDPQTRLVNGDLEEVKGDHFLGFSFQDDPGQTTFADREVVHHGKVSCRMQDVTLRSSSGNCRLIQRVKVRPHACYRLSCWVKTQDLKPAHAFRLVVLGTSTDNLQLTFQEGAVQPTQDWKHVEVVFNSLEEEAVQVYIGLWGGSTGKVWLDELAVEELALVNVLRRDGCPFQVASADGHTVYREGEDFQDVRDPRLGQDPYAGQYDFHHPGAPLRLTKSSRITDGARLRVSWYYPIITQDSQVMCCLSEPKVYDLLRDEARRVNDLLQPRTFLMSHDEIRVANWCQRCQSRRLTPGELLADNARRCVAILKEVNPRARVVVWSDMFDPNHNAVDHYYLVHGTLAGSWKGLADTVIIANWNSGKAKESLKWFAEHGHTQVIAGYYDSGPENFKEWDAAARGVRGVIGFMYTTWEQQYGLLDEYAKLLIGRH